MVNTITKYYASNYAYCILYIYIIYMHRARVYYSIATSTIVDSSIIVVLVK